MSSRSDSPEKPVVLVVAVADNNVIGRDNAMPWYIPEDFRHFKAVTMGKPCIMGRKTFESILEKLGKPLPGRVNIVISRKNPQYTGAITCESLKEALFQAQRCDAEEICVIGGAEVYAQALPLAQKIYLTRVHQTPEGDAHFPELDLSQWTEKERDESVNGVSFLLYERI